MYIIAGSWDKARKTANKANPQLQQEVENLYKNHLLEMGEADQLVKTGNFLEALELYVKQDRWGKAHDVASLLGTSTVKEFSVRHARHCLNQHKCCEAISILAQYGVPDNRVSYEFCIAAARKLFNSTEDSSVLEKSFQTLRTILYQIVNISSHVSDVDCTPVLEEINKHLLVAHYITVGYTCKSQGLKEIEAKLKVSLLRYAGLLPADKVFYEAGIASKQLGWQNMAFMFLNRYLDITEAMDEADRPDTAIMDGAGFETSDIPEEFPLPRTHALEEHTTEEIRDWVIQLSMDQKVHPSLPMRTCEQCETEIYVASLSCFSCKAENEACCVTGYPVLEKNMFHCKNCQMLADRGDWFKFLSKCHKCPWCSHSQKADISPHRNTTQWYLTNNNLLFEE